MNTKYIKESSLLLEITVPFRLVNGEILMEVQAHNGLGRWLDNFEKITVCAPVEMPNSNSKVEYCPIEYFSTHPGLTVHVLPYGYNMRAHYQKKKEVEALFRLLIPQHQYLCFSSLGWWGEWGTIAANVAYELKRPYAVWLDWVIDEMPTEMTGSFVRNLVRKFRSHRSNKIALRSIRQSSLGLFHGQTVFNAYSPICPVSEVVHDVHLKRADIIDAIYHEERIARSHSTLRIGYVGRVHPMKAPSQWIKVVERAESILGSTVKIEAVWLGDGPLLDECQHEVATHKLDSLIEFRGRVSERGKVLEFLRGLDLFLFCHVTPESPRCLIEALMSGVPIVGYDSAYAQDLVAACGGGKFVPIGDVEGLAKLLCNIGSDNAALVDLSRKALESGKQFSDDVVFKHRSDLIKKHLG